MREVAVRCSITDNRHIMPDNNGSTDNGDAISSWSTQVIEEHAQADRVRSDDPNADNWKKLAHRFAPAERKQALQDESLIAVLKYIRPADTVLDVGAGAGRLAVPVAESCKHVTAVEPSEAMRERLAEQARAWGVTNLEIVGSTWEEAEVKPADVVICAHVIYTAREIELFLRKLTEASRRDVIVIVFEEPAMANYFPLWELVYGEKRIFLPTLPELRDVLAQMDISYDAEPLPTWESRPFKDAESAHEESMTRLFLSPGSDGATRLAEVLPDTLVPVGDGVRFKWATPHRPWLVRWNGSG
jgi:2-polyprenyl-3-methyl-5-hydroxy-6-metoxy-1,4-benzoquinol methylase